MGRAATYHRALRRPERTGARPDGPPGTASGVPVRVGHPEPLDGASLEVESRSGPPVHRPRPSRRAPARSPRSAAPCAPRRSRRRIGCGSRRAPGNRRARACRGRCRLPASCPRTSGIPADKSCASRARRRRFPTSSRTCPMSLRSAPLTGAKSADVGAGAAAVRRVGFAAALRGRAAGLAPFLTAFFVFVVRFIDDVSLSSAISADCALDDVAFDFLAMVPRVSWTSDARHRWPAGIIGSLRRNQDLYSLIGRGGVRAARRGVLPPGARRRRDRADVPAGRSGRAPVRLRDFLVGRFGGPLRYVESRGTPGSAQGIHRSPSRRRRVNAGFS